MDAATTNLIATLILVGITAWYAISAAKMLGEMRRQAEASRRQSLLMLKSVQIAALTALGEAAGHPTGENPIPKLRGLLNQLEKLDAEESLKVARDG
jgi:hypothetical protein